MATQRFIVEAGVSGEDLWRVPAAARRLEALGYTAAISPEVNRDAFLPLLMAAEHTTRLQLATSVAIAFPRAPMIVAQLSWDLQRFSRGRFFLGLGSQVRKHNEERFAVKWTAPVSRMREYIQTLRAIWDHWQTGGKPAFVGDHYRFTYSAPFFNAGPIEHPRIPIAIAAVNPAMCRLAGELCDGVRLHNFCTRAYLEQTILPNIAAGAARTGRSAATVELSGGGFIATGRDDAAVAKALEGIRRQVSFYGSTPAYVGVLDAHGWGELGARLNAMSRRGEWDTMAAAIPDDVVRAFATVGRYDEIVPRLRARCAGIGRIAFPPPAEEARDEGTVRELLQELTGS